MYNSFRGLLLSMLGSLLSNFASKLFLGHLRVPGIDPIYHLAIISVVQLI